METVSSPRQTWLLVIITEDETVATVFPSREDAEEASTSFHDEAIEVFISRVDYHWTREA